MATYKFKVILGHMRPYLRRKEERKKEKPCAEARRKVRAFLSSFQPPTCLRLLEAEAISVCLRVFWGHLRLGFPAAGEVPEFPEPSQDWHLAQHPLANSTPVPFEGCVHCPLLALGTWLRQGYRASWFIPPDSSLGQAWGLGFHCRPRPLLPHRGCCSQPRDFPS